MNKRSSLTSPASAQFYLSKATFGDEPSAGEHQFVPTKYCMCLNCGQELWADTGVTTVPECFACRGQVSQVPVSKGDGTLQPPQATKSSENIFLGSLRKSREHSSATSRSPRPAGPEAQAGAQRAVRQAQRPESGGAGLAQQVEKRPSSGARDGPGCKGSAGPDRTVSSGSGTLSEQMRRFRKEDINLGLLGRTPSKEKVDSGVTAGASGKSTCQVSKLLARQAQRDYDLQAATLNSSRNKLEERRKRLNEIVGSRDSGSKESASRPTQSQSTPNLPGIGQPLLKPSSPVATGNQMLDSVLGKLNKPKLMGALDRMVKEVGTNKKTLKGAFKEFDLNGDGILSKEEMSIGLRKLGVSLLPSELDAVMRALDVDQNGLVEVDEVIEIVSAYRAHFKLDDAAEKDKAEAQVADKDKLKSPPRALGAVGGRRPAHPGKLF